MIEIFRESGRPVNLQKFREYEAEFKILSGKIIDRWGKKSQDFPKAQRAYAMLDKQLLQKYYAPVFVQDFAEIEQLIVELGENIEFGMDVNNRLIGMVKDRSMKQY
jgi:hypothetical protein